MKKKIDELLIQLHEVEKNIKRKPRILKSNAEGFLLLNPYSPNDVEWYENDADYDVISNAFEQARATLEIEGVQLTADDEQAIKDVASGKTTRDQLIQNLISEGNGSVESIIENFKKTLNESDADLVAVNREDLTELIRVFEKISSDLMIDDLEPIYKVKG